MTAIQKENEELKTENFLLKEENAQLKKLLFSSKRERFQGVENPQQTQLFDHPEQREPLQEEKQVVVKKKKKATNRKGVKRNDFPAGLRREEVVILPQGNLEGFTQIGEDITEILAYTQADFYVKKIIRPRLVDKKEEDNGVLQALVPPRIVPAGMVDESLIAQIIVEKIQFHTPIHRFVKKMKQAGVGFIKANNLHNWFHTGAHSLLPLYHLLIKDILTQGYIQGDETPIPVLSKNKPGATHRGYMWAFHSPDIKAVAFNYDPSRSTQAAQIILDDFSGILQTDGYTVYENIAKREDIELIYCMAHARRKFFDAQQTNSSLAQYFLNRLQVLYEIERQARDGKYAFDQRLQLRQDKAVPILRELEQWLIEQHADKTLLPKSLIRKAIDYSLSRWKGLMAYAHNGRLEIDNNLVENTIRPIALGRKNYMFAGSHDAAQNLAVLYSIIGTCEKNNINAHQYLHWLLRKVATCKITPQALNWLPHHIDPQILVDFVG